MKKTILKKSKTTKNEKKQVYFQADIPSPDPIPKIKIPNFVSQPFINIKKKELQSIGNFDEYEEPLENEEFRVQKMKSPLLRKTKTENKKIEQNTPKIFDKGNDEENENDPEKEKRVIASFLKMETIGGGKNIPKLLRKVISLAKAILKLPHILYFDQDALDFGYPKSWALNYAKISSIFGDRLVLGIMKSPKKIFYFDEALVFHKDQLFETGDPTELLSNEFSMVSRRMRREDPLFYEAWKNGVSYKELLAFKRKVNERRKRTLLMTEHEIENFKEEVVENPIIEYHRKQSARNSQFPKYSERNNSGDQKSSRRSRRVSQDDDGITTGAQNFEITVPNNMTTFRGIKSIKGSFNELSHRTYKSSKNWKMEKKSLDDSSEVDIDNDCKEGR